MTQIKHNPKLVFSNSSTTSVGFRDELKMLSKFSSHINPIECKTEEEKILKAKIEETILDDVEKKIDEKIKSFAEKLVTNVKSSKGPYSGKFKSSHTKQFSHNDPQIGKTEIGEHFEPEEGWYVGGTAEDKQVRVDEERLAQLKEISSYVDLKEHIGSSHNKSLDLQALGKELFRGDYGIHEKTMHPNSTKTEDNKKLVEVATKINEEIKKKTTKKKSAKKSAKKKTSKKKTTKRSINGKQVKGRSSSR